MYISHIAECTTAKEEAKAVVNVRVISVLAFLGRTPWKYRLAAQLGAVRQTGFLGGVLRHQHLIWGECPRSGRGWVRSRFGPPPASLGPVADRGGLEGLPSSLDRRCGNASGPCVCVRMREFLS